MNQGIRYVVGDATRPDAAGNKVIVHICVGRLNEP